MRPKGFSLNVKTVLFEAIQFSSMLPMDSTLSGPTTTGQSELGSDGNEGILNISQSSSITGASPSDCLGSYPGPSLVGNSQCILQLQPTGQ